MATADEQGEGAGNGTAEGAGPDDASAETAWQRRRRLDAVFGDVLPTTTSDERGDAPEADGDDWLRRQVPPHHG